MKLNAVGHSEFFGLKTMQPAYKFKIWMIFYPRSPFNQGLIWNNLIPTKVKSTTPLEELWLVVFEVLQI